MKKVLMTGGTGFIGKNIIPILSQSVDIISPSRNELNLKDETAVREFIKNNKIDIVLHSANPNPVKNILDKQDTMIEDSMRIFFNLYSSRECYEKLFYFGSGAEYDKSMEICSIKEEDCFRSIPKDSYGLSKYIFNSLADKSENIYNLCIFACYGPYDHPSKFITHCINCCMRNEKITIRQDCYFDYLHVFDLGRMVAWHLQNDQKYHMYNMSSGKRVKLSEIAYEVRNQMGADVPITILSQGLNREYSASNERFVRESGIYPTISLEDGIAKQIEWEREHK